MPSQLASGLARQPVGGQQAQRRAPLCCCCHHSAPAAGCTGAVAAVVGAPPLTEGAQVPVLMDDPALQKVAKKLGKNPGQVCPTQPDRVHPVSGPR